jgi:toxin YhaV
MTEAQLTPLVLNGWTIYAHPLFLDQVGELIQKVEALKAKDPRDWKRKNAAKRLAAIVKVAFDLIPQDPTHSRFRQGDTLGEDYKHWFRAKFLQQYRLFFRYQAQAKVILLAWVNELEGGKPPDSWDDLLKEAGTGEERLKQVAAAVIGAAPR